MKSKKYYDLMAEAFVAEGVDAHFALMGDANMHWGSALAELPGVRSIYVRHEHNAAAMAMGYYSATGKVGVASVTCGPGFTQVMTALTCAAQSRVPMVLFAGDAPITWRWYNQKVEYAPLALATGAHYIAAHSPARMLDYVQEAFYIARYERRPVVLGVPHDLQKLPAPEGLVYTPSTAVLPAVGPMPPNPDDIDNVARQLLAAHRPILMAGRGVMDAGAEAAVEALAESTGALLATTLPARGMFDHNPFSIGVSGGFASLVAAEQFTEADFVLAVGASLTYFTTENGTAYPKAVVAQIDQQPMGRRHGIKAASHYVRADARLGVEALLARVETLGGAAAEVRTEALANRIRQLPADDALIRITDGFLDPRAVVSVLDETIPKDWDMVSGSGHSSYFPTHMKGRKPAKFHVMREFGAIGNSLGQAIGVSVALNSDEVALIDGDGGMLMHIQELETIARHRMKMLIVVLNDGAFGAGIHKLREEGISDRGAVFGRPDFAAIAKGFGLAGTTVTDLNAIPDLFRAHQAGSVTTVWDIRITDQVVSPRMRRQTAGLRKK